MSKTLYYTGLCLAIRYKVILLNFVLSTYHTWKVDMIQAGSLFYGVTLLNIIYNVHRNTESATQEHLVT